MGALSGQVVGKPNENAECALLSQVIVTTAHYRQGARAWFLSFLHETFWRLLQPHALVCWRLPEQYLEEVTFLFGNWLLGGFALCTLSTMRQMAYHHACYLQSEGVHYVHCASFNIEHGIFMIWCCTNTSTKLLKCLRTILCARKRNRRSRTSSWK